MFNHIQHQSASFDAGALRTYLYRSRLSNYSTIGKAFLKPCVRSDGSFTVIYPYTRLSRFQAGLGTFDYCACYPSDLEIVKASFMSITGVII